MAALFLAAALSPGAPAQTAPAETPQAQPRWYRGNTHTLNSDGDSPPETVVRWYKEHGWHFVVLTDHDLRTPVEGLNATFAAPEKFLVVPGVEVTDRFEQASVHVNGIAVRETVKPQRGSGVVDVLNRDAQAIRAAGGVPQINHPNWGWSLTAEHVTAAREANLFELHNGHGFVNNRGGGGAPSTEELWDIVLSAGRVIYGVASDDAHHFQGEFAAPRQNPGRAWVMVRATALTTEALAAALERGDFYASTGVELKAYAADAAGIRIELPSAPWNPPRYRTFFIGRNGAVLKRDDSLQPSYQFRGDELYVRARVESSNGTFAWTQPLFVRNQQPAK